MDEGESAERLVRRYRPVGPPDALRARVLGAARARHQPRVRWALPLVAAAAIVFFHVMAADVRAQIGRHLSVLQQARQSVVDDLTAQFGGDEFASTQAEVLVAAAEETVHE